MPLYIGILKKDFKMSEPFKDLMKKAGVKIVSYNKNIGTIKLSSDKMINEEISNDIIYLEKDASVNLIYEEE